MQSTRTRSLVTAAVALAAIVAAGLVLRYELHASSPDALYDQARAARLVGKPGRPPRQASAHIEPSHRTGEPASAHAPNQKKNGNEQAPPADAKAAKDGAPSQP
jgi:hypothetical protein